MSELQIKEDERTVLFTGRSSVSQRYKIIGSQLLFIEGEIGSFRSAFSYPTRRITNFRSECWVPAKLMRLFREGVAFVPVEILESYLDDLLDLEIADERLFISSSRRVFPSAIVALFGLALALATGLYIQSQGASLSTSFFFTIVSSLPFMMLWHLAPQDRLSRRMRFSQIIAAEISYRRGVDPTIPTVGQDLGWQPQSQREVGGAATLGCLLVRPNLN